MGQRVLGLIFGLGVGWGEWKLLYDLLSKDFLQSEEKT